MKELPAKILWILHLYMIVNATKACVYGPGSECMFECHCQLQDEGDVCDRETGSCSSGCSNGAPAGFPWTGEGCRIGNVAYGKAATQSGIWDGNDANRAVDGDTNADLERGSCAHPEAASGSQAWWMVDLGSTHAVMRVTVYNRDQSSHRMKQFTIRVGDDPNITNQVACGYHEDPVPAGGNATILCSRALEGRYVSMRIEHTGSDNNVFTLCEAVVDGYKPIDCTQCPSSQFCNVYTGCDACPAGRLKPDCMRECQHNKYSIDCQHQCHCKDDAACENAYGNCPNGCEDWYITDSCNISLEVPDLSNKALEVTSSNHNSITLTWPVPTYSTEAKKHYIYKVQVKTPSSSGFTTLSTIKHEDISRQKAEVRIQGLQEKTLYEIRVVPYRVMTEQAGNSVLESEGVASPSVEVYTSTAPSTTTTTPRPPLPPGEGPDGQVKDLVPGAGNGQSQLLAPDNTGLIAGIVIGGLLLIAMVVIAALLLIRRLHSSGGAISSSTPKKRRVSRSKIQVMHDPEAAMQVLGMENNNNAAQQKPAVPPRPPVTDPVYNNDPVPPLPVAKLQDYIDNSKRDESPFKAEFNAIPNGERYPCERGALPENYKVKNRFLNIMAYDRTRVVLELEEGDPLSDYINANYLTGYKDTPKAYVACQGPRPATLADMWRLIWQLNTNRIAMVTKEFENGKRKCERYWPEKVGQSVRYGKIRVTSINTETFADYVIRTFSVTNQDSPPRTIHHFHYTSWPDKRPPMYAFPLLAFRRKVRSYDAEAQGPLIVHCSAGVGRTGTFLALDYLLQQAEEEDTVDVQGLVDRMRTERVNMIQTLDQYIFVYDALLEAITQGDTTIPAADFTQTYEQLRAVPDGAKISKLEEQFQYLVDFNPKHKDSDVYSALLKENIDKNRDSTVVARDNARPFLQTRVNADCTDYINAVFVHSYRVSQAYLATHMPLPHTVVDLWRMVYDDQCNTIVMLNEYDSADESAPMYWPADADHPLNFGPLEIKEAEVRDDHPNITVRDLLVCHSDTIAPLKVRQFQVHGSWVSGDAEVPEDPSALCDLLENIDRWQQHAGQSKIIVHCLNGVARTGLFCAAAHLLEKLRVEQEVDIFTSVKHIKVSRPEFIATMEQYVFLHELAQNYMSGFDTYSNFK